MNILISWMLLVAGLLAGEPMMIVGAGLFALAAAEAYQKGA